MRSKAPLALIEQLIMVLVFALAAVLCLQGFVLSDQTSRRNAERDQAVLIAQNAAEALKVSGGDYERAGAALGIDGQWDDAGWTVAFDEDWQETDVQTACYVLSVDQGFVPLEETDSHNPPERWQPMLSKAQVDVSYASGESLFELTVAWQEVAHG